MSTYYRNGITDDSAAGQIIKSDLIHTETIRWVDSATGLGGNPGTEEEPLDTLDNAISASGTDDIIILKSGHSEIISAPLSIGTKGLRIFGLGSGTSAPSFTCNAAIDMLTLADESIYIDNLRLLAGTTAVNTSRLRFNDARCTIINCTFLCGVNDSDTIFLSASADVARIENCTFIVTADGPNKGINGGAVGINFLYVKGCTFDAASIGWDDGAIFSDQALISFLYENNILKNGADIIHTSTATGLVTGTVADNDCRVEV